MNTLKNISFLSCLLNGPDYKEEDLKLQLITIGSNHRFVGLLTDNYIGWCVERVDVEVFKKGKIISQNVTMSDQADALDLYLTKVAGTGVYKSKNHIGK